MKAKFIFLVSVITVLSENVNSQIILSVKETILSGKDKEILDKHISKYATFAMDKKEIIDSLYKKGICQFRIRVDEKLDWTFELEFNDMRASDFRQTYTTDEGEFEPEPYILNTFKGKTSDNQIVRFSIDENTFFGVILGNKEHYVIRSVKDYTKNSSDENLIVYNSSDIITKDEHIDYINDALEFPEDDENESVEQDMTKSSTTSYASCKWYLKIATDADYEFYVNRGNSNLAKTYSEIFSILNIVEGVYESTFNMKFIITFQNVYTTSNTPYTSTDPHTLLDQFQYYWNHYKDHVSRNIAHLFTGKSLSIYGVAKTGHIGDSYSYSLSRNRENMYQTTAHEIGHNLNAKHPTSINCLCEKEHASVMCQGNKDPNLWFCGQSISEILPFIHDKKSHLTGSISSSLNLSGSLTEFHTYEVAQTITSTQIINNGFTSYKAGTQIILSPGFHAKEGSRFIASIGNISNCDNWEPITVSSWINAVCRNQELRFNVTNAVSYRIDIASIYSTMVYSGQGDISGNPVIVWNASVDAGSYLMKISFYSPVYEETRTYMLEVVYGVGPCRNNAPAVVETEADQIVLQKTLPDNQFDFNIYPNPNDGNFTLTINTKEIQPFFVEVFNTSGVLVSKAEYGNEYQIDLDYRGLPQGIYYVKLSMGDNISTKKIVIQ